MTIARRSLRGAIALALTGLLAALLAGVGIFLASAQVVPDVAPLIAGLAIAFVLGALAVLGLTAAATRTVVRRLDHLTKATQYLVDEGRLSVVPPGPPDEVGRLARAFNATALLLRDRFADLGAEHRQLETVLATMADGVVIVDADERVRLVNPAASAILRVDPPTDDGRSLVDALRDHELVELCRHSRESHATHTRFLTLSAGDRAVQAIAASISHGGAEQTLLLLRDLTEIRQTAAMRREFVANVSHELRTPVTALKALIETLEGGAIDDPSTRADFLRRIHDEVDRISGLVEEQLDLARIESGAAELQRRAVDLRTVVGRAAERLRPQAQRSGVALDTQPADGALLVHVDAERLGQVVTSLVHNAIKFTPPGGAVTVSVRVQAEEVIIAVADNGAGIEAEAIPRLFERFFKADRARSGGGAGLGLAIAKHVVQEHGGRIWAESPGLGRGATFFVALPYGG